MNKKIVLTGKEADKWARKNKIGKSNSKIPKIIYKIIGKIAYILMDCFIILKNKCCEIGAYCYAKKN